jgi:hypothetical protein
MFNIKPKTLYHWYCDHLSNYKPDIEQGKWLKDKIPIADQQTGEILSESPVYIARPENVGERMNIDDKQIGKDVFTIMTNRDAGKIALMVETTKVEELLFDKFPQLQTANQLAEDFYNLAHSR